MTTPVPLSAAEQQAERKRQAKIRRQPLVLIALVNVLILGVGVTAVVDLRRLHTPGGTALRWANAAVVGNCGDYLEFSVPDPAGSDSRSRDQLCKDLRAATAASRLELQRDLRLARVTSAGSRARVDLTLVRMAGSKRVTVQLVRLQGHWRVVRDALTCGSFGCP